MAKEHKLNLEHIRHSLAHLLAMAVPKKIPQAQLGIGPVIENGFYYDFELPKPITDTDLPEFEKTMRELIAQKLDFSGEKITPAQAKKILKDHPFKLELIKEYSQEKKQLTAYYTCPTSTNYKLQTTNCFIDLCKGGHAKNTSEINPEAFRLTHIAGAYWRGSEKNPMLTRIYVVAFKTKKEFDEYLKLQEEAAKKDHRVLGEKLELFTFSDKVGKGLPLWLPKGAFIRKKLE